jgi:hypothetical protein
MSPEDLGRLTVEQLTQYTKWAKDWAKSQSQQQ